MAFPSAFIVGSTLYLRPTSDLTTGTAHWVLADAGSLKDASDVEWGGIGSASTWNFTTEGTAPTSLVAFFDLDAVLADGDGGNTASVASSPPTLGYTAADFDSWLTAADTIAAWGDTYMYEGTTSLQAAENMRDWLVDFATNDYMRGSSGSIDPGDVKDAQVHRNWALCSLLPAYYKARGSAEFSSGDKTLIEGWIDDHCNDITTYYDWDVDDLGSKNNNHLMAASLARMWGAIILNDTGHFDESVSSVKHVLDDLIDDSIANDAVDRRMVGYGSDPQDDYPPGGLMLELDRGNSAFFYQSYWTSWATVVAANALANGEDLFRYAGTYGTFFEIYDFWRINVADSGQTIFDLVTEWADSGAPSSAAALEVNTGDTWSEDADKFASFQIFSTLFPDHAASSLINTNMGGGTNYQYGGDIDYLVDYLSPASSPVNVEFGALTLAGAGGIAIPGGVTAIVGNGGTNLEIVSGEFVPKTGGGVVSGSELLDDGSTLVVTVVANKYSCKPDETEVAAALSDANTSTALGILLRDGDDSGSSQWDLTGKSFSNEFIIEPHDWTEETDVRDQTYGVFLPGIKITGGGNMTIQGCDLYRVKGAGAETDGVVWFVGPVTNPTVRKNRIHSRDMYDTYDAGDFGTLGIQYGGIRGVKLDGSSGNLITGATVDDNLIEHVTRGVVAGFIEDDGGGNNSSISGNYIYDFYSNGTTVGSSDGVDIFDNDIQHAWAANGDNGSPHSSVGLSFDSPCVNINVLGNLADVGWSRTKYAADNANPAPTLAATGMKANDPTSSTAYTNWSVGFNTIISHGICLEFSGADTIDIFNNTLVNEDYTGGTGSATYYFQGADNVTMRNNIGQVYTLGGNDGGTENGQSMSETLATLSGYGNLILNGAGDTGAFDPENYFVGDGVKGFDELTSDETRAAYVPNSGEYALTASEKKGALGTGYYSGGGSHTAPAHSKPAADSGTPDTPSETVWDGSTFAVGGRLQESASDIADGKYLTIAWEGSIHSDIDASNKYLLASQFSRVAIQKLGPKWRLFVDDVNGDQLLTATTPDGKDYDSSSGTLSLAWSVDVANGRVLFADGGEVFDLPLSGGVPADDLDIDLSGPSSWRIYSDAIGANIFKGTLRKLLITNLFVDLETEAGLEKLYASDGTFKDWGSTGSSIDGATERVVFVGDASTINAGNGNGGDGGAFTVSGGTVTDLASDVGITVIGSSEDANSSSSYTPTPDLSSLSNGDDVLVIVHTHDLGNFQVPSSVSLGGTSLTKIIGTTQTTTQDGSTSMWRGTLSGSPTDTLTIGYGVTVNGAAWEILKLTNANATLSDSDEQNGSVTLDVPTGGAVIAGGWHNSGTGPMTMTSDAATLTLIDNTSWDSRQRCAYYRADGTARTGEGITTDAGVSTSQHVVAISLAPA